MKCDNPSLNILDAFGVSGSPVRLTGGQGTSYLADNIVLKPTTNEVEACWVADVFDKLNSDKFRVAKPVRAKNNSWVFDKWVAYSFIKGKHLKNKYSEMIKVSKNFHESLKKIPKPSFLEKNVNAWSIADKIAWEELPIPRNKLTNDSFDKIFNNLKKANYRIK